MENHHGSELGEMDFETIANPFPENNIRKSQFKSLTNLKSGSSQEEKGGGVGAKEDDTLLNQLLSKKGSAFDLAMEATKKKLTIDELVESKLRVLRRNQGQADEGQGKMNPEDDPTIIFAPTSQDDPALKAHKLKIHLSEEIKSRFHHVMANLASIRDDDSSDNGNLAAKSSNLNQRLLKKKLGEEIGLRFQQVVHEHLKNSKEEKASSALKSSNSASNLLKSKTGSFGSINRLTDNSIPSYSELTKDVLRNISNSNHSQQHEVNSISSMRKAQKDAEKLLSSAERSLSGEDLRQISLKDVADRYGEGLSKLPTISEKRQIVGGSKTNLQNDSSLRKSAQNLRGGSSASNLRSSKSISSNNLAKNNVTASSSRLNGDLTAAQIARKEATLERKQEMERARSSSNNLGSTSNLRKNVSKSATQLNGNSNNAPGKKSAKASTENLSSSSSSKGNKKTSSSSSIKKLNGNGNG